MLGYSTIKNLKSESPEIRSVKLSLNWNSLVLLCSNAFRRCRLNGKLCRALIRLVWIASVYKYVDNNVNLNLVR